MIGVGRVFDNCARVETQQQIPTFPPPPHCVCVCVCVCSHDEMEGGGEVGEKYVLTDMCQRGKRSRRGGGGGGEEEVMRRGGEERKREDEESTSKRDE